MTTAYGSRHKLAVAALANSSLSRGSADDVTEAFASRAFGEHRLIPTAPALSPKICSKIGQQLQEIYDSVLREPLPDQFSELLNRAEYARG